MTRPYSHLVPIVLTVLALGVNTSVRANADNEREKLAIISNELVRLQELVAEASRYADSTSRVRFRYDNLLSDLKLVKDGVDAHADAPRQPRPVAPLKGDYRR